MSSKPVIVAASFPASGHTNGPLQIASHLVSQGHKVYYIASPSYKTAITSSGLVYVENPYDIPEAYLIARDQITDVAARMISDMCHVFFDSTLPHHHLLSNTLSRARDENPGSEIIILHEMLYQGLMPFYYGAPLPRGFDKVPPVVNVSTSNNLAWEDGLPPFGPGMEYIPTEENKALWRAVYERMKQEHEGAHGYLNGILEKLGCNGRVEGNIFSVWVEMGDVTLFPTSESTEYPRKKSDRVRYIGGLPLKKAAADWTFPEWWNRIENKGNKKVVFATQGTVRLGYDEMILPTLRALADREDFIVVATLGKRGAELEGEVPRNAIVVDYLPYDVMLPHTDVFVTNAGYNGFMHGIMNGTPMVVAGVDEDKAEVSNRAEYCGVAVNLRARMPSEQQIRDGVDKVLGNPGYKARALELKRENEEMDSLRRVELVIAELLARTGR
ncbi:hypothetical protein OQA88_8927 [Cercophora sp. LCS_1]